MLLARSEGLRCAVESVREREKEKTSPMEETAQIVVPPDVTFVIMLGAYICRGRNIDDDDTAELSANLSNGNLH
jgi:hypothetical protein